MPARKSRALNPEMLRPQTRTQNLKPFNCKHYNVIPLNCLFFFHFLIARQIRPRKVHLRILFLNASIFCENALIYRSNFFTFS